MSVTVTVGLSAASSVFTWAVTRAAGRRATDAERRKRIAAEVRSAARGREVAELKAHRPGVLDVLAAIPDDHPGWARLIAAVENEPPPTWSIPDDASELVAEQNRRAAWPTLPAVRSWRCPAPGCTRTEDGEREAPYCPVHRHLPMNEVIDLREPKDGAR